jgi:hypothetical protein
VKAFGHAEGQTGAAEQALEGAHQVEVADETQVAGLTESKSDFIEGHRARRPDVAAASPPREEARAR